MKSASTDVKRKPQDGSKTMSTPLSAEDLRKMDAYWRASNYLSVGQIYLLDNPLLKEPLKREHIKPRLLGHWGTCPGLNMLYVHLNRVIKRNRSEEHTSELQSLRHLVCRLLLEKKK